MDTLIKLLMAMVMGGIIGFERQSSKRPAGLKTHILVTLGATLVMIVSKQGFADDSARIAAQVVSGVGFLGAGTILVRGKSVYGLTTAASLWICACIGLAIGIGFYMESLMTLAVVLISLGPLNSLQKLIFKEEYTTILQVKYIGEIKVEEMYDSLSDVKADVEFMEIDRLSKVMTINLLCYDPMAIKKAKSVLLHHKDVIGFEKVHTS